MTPRIFRLLLIQIIFVTFVLSQDNTQYSLQPALDALHRREAHLIYKDYENPRYQNGYFKDENLMREYRINQLLADYLQNHDNDENENLEYGQDLDENNYGMIDEQKRTNFHQRNENPFKSSVFRERAMDNQFREQQQFQQQPSQSDLTREFLKEIDQERDAEREELYKENLHHLWEKFQQQENEMETKLFDDNADQVHVNSKSTENGNGFSPPKHYTNSNEMLPIYMTNNGIEKRDMILPWLPAARRKRFPVAKRSPKMFMNNNGPPSAEHHSLQFDNTNEKIAKDLEAIFDDDTTLIDDSKNKQSAKLSSMEPKNLHEKSTPTTTTVVPLTPQVASSSVMTSKNNHKIEKKSPRSLLPTNNNKNEHYEDDDDDDDNDDNDEEDHYDPSHDSHNHNHDHHTDDDDTYEDDEDDEERKKRRAIAMQKRSNPEVFKEDQIIPGDLTDIKRKKSIPWSKYFGIDRKKKSSNDWIGNLHKNQNEPKHHELNEEKLNNMDHKLKMIEDLIIDETVKYTGAHEGISNPEDIQRLKDHVVSRLATAYSLEKMRRALDKLKQSVDNKNHLTKNEIQSNANANADADAIDKEKRVAIKKEKAEFDNNNHQIESSTEKITHEMPENTLNEDDKKKKKKRNGLNRNIQDINQNNDMGDFEDELGAGHFEPMSEGYMGGGGGAGVIANANKHFTPPAITQCPLLEAMEKRCHGVDLLSGDIHQNLLPVCEVHQICYVCGTSQPSCDFQYLSEADAICGHNKDCLSAARSALMILRGSPGPQLGPRECLKNPCLYRALQNFGFY